MSLASTDTADLHEADAAASASDAARSSACNAPVDDPIEVLRFTRFESQAAGGVRHGVSSLQLSGMYCAACAGLIESALCSVPGVLEAHVNAASQRATVRWDPGRTQPSTLLSAVQAAGYGAVPDAAQPARLQRRAQQRATLWRLFVASFCAMQVMMLATPSYVSAPGELDPNLRQLLNWGSWVLSLPVVWFAGLPFLQGAWQSLRMRRIGMDVPVALGILVTFVASTGATFDPNGIFGHEVYFDSLTMFVAFLWVGRWLEMRARHQAAQALESALTGMPATALRVSEDGTVTEISAARLKPGDRVRVPTGSAIPADGPLLTATAGVGEALITGESQAVAKRCGDGMLAGSVNLGAPLEMTVDRVGADTRQEAIVAMIREAMGQRPAAARLADRWAGPFLWAVLLLAAGSAAVWSIIDPSRALWVGVAVLIVTCPCALSLATPATLVAAAGGLARRGVLLRRVDALEAFAESRHVFIDKTGTLTTGAQHLEEVRVVSGAPVGLTTTRALQMAASLARWSSHPLSLALVAAAGHGTSAQPEWRGLTETAGSGLRAHDENGIEWRLGSAAWVGAQDGDTLGAVWLGRSGCPAAAFRFEEMPQVDAAATVAALRASGMHVTLLSGDTQSRARRLAAMVGIDDVAASATPEDKLAALKSAQAGGARVAMVGDGLNDGPVLAAADVSLAMGHGALASRQSADAVIVSGRPAGILDMHLTALHTVRIVRQNLLWAVIYNGACIPLAMTGWLPPWAAGLGMAASSLLVVLNAQRAAASRLP